MRMSSRPARTLVIALVLGAVTNVLVTAWCVYAATSSRDRTVELWDSGEGVYMISHESGIGKVRYAWSKRGPMSANAVQTFRDEGAVLIDRPLSWSTLNSAAWTERVGASPGGSSLRVDIGYGWPWLSFCGGHTYLASSPLLREDDFTPTLPDRLIASSDEWGAKTLRETRALPLRPIVPGMMANTGVYAGVW